MAEVVAVHRARRLALLDDGRTAPFSTLLADGEKTDDATAATVAAASLDGRWLVIDLRKFEPVETH